MNRFNKIITITLVAAAFGAIPAAEAMNGRQRGMVQNDAQSKQSSVNSWLKAGVLGYGAYKLCQSGLLSSAATFAKAHPVWGTLGAVAGSALVYSNAQNIDNIADSTINAGKYVVMLPVYAAALAAYGIYSGVKFTYDISKAAVVGAKEGAKGAFKAIKQTPDLAKNNFNLTQAKRADYYNYNNHGYYYSKCGDFALNARSGDYWNLRTSPHTNLGQ